MEYVRACIRDWVLNSEGQAAQRVRTWLGIHLYARYGYEGRTLRSVQKAANLPTSFKLYGRTWKVVMRERLLKVLPNNEAQDIYGLCHFEEGLIEIARTIEGRELPKSVIQQTLIHEFIHAALYDMGRKDCADEDFVCGLEGMVWQYLITARGVKYKQRLQHG